AQGAGFPLSHRHDGDWFMSQPKTKTGHFTCYEKRTFSLATNSGKAKSGASAPHFVPDSSGFDEEESGIVSV
ncbi:MAG: hypothetical protein WB555_19700, partial [Candidatus Korobacteraceae bacterium]